jgi:competence ComEA-like helix-hairpin-helix protein
LSAAFLIIAFLGASTPVLSQVDQQINLNTASEAALGAIPGMPAHIAVLIVKYREEYGAFADVRDILKVPGMTQEIYGRVNSRLAIKPAMPPPAPAPTPQPAVLLEVPPSIRPIETGALALPPPALRSSAPPTSAIPGAGGTARPPAAAPPTPQPMIRTVSAPPIETGPPVMVVTGIAPATSAEPAIRREMPIEAPTPSTSPFEAAPRLRSSRRDETPVSMPVVEQRFEASLDPRLGADRRERHTLAIEVEQTDVKWNTPFQVILRAYDEAGLLAASFNAPVTYECANGVVPILSPARWRNGHLFDTVVIARPGRNVRLTAAAGEAIAAIHLHVMASTPDRLIWIRQAEEFLAVGKIDDGIHALKKAAEMAESEEASAIERRIGRLYLDRGQWDKAEEHYQRGLRAIAR